MNHTDIRMHLVVGADDPQLQAALMEYHRQLLVDNNKISHLLNEEHNIELK